MSEFLSVAYVRRREFLSLVSGAAAAWPIAARAQQPAANVARIGYLGSARAAAFATRVEAMRGGLRDLGYVEGRTIISNFDGLNVRISFPRLPPIWRAWTSIAF